MWYVASRGLWVLAILIKICSNEEKGHMQGNPDLTGWEMMEKLETHILEAT